MNIKNALSSLDTANDNFYFNDIEVIPEEVKAILINEVVPSNPYDDFYGSMIERSLPYLEKELSLFPNVKVIMLMGVWQKRQ